MSNPAADIFNAELRKLADKLGVAKASDGNDLGGSAVASWLKYLVLIIWGVWLVAFLAVQVFLGNNAWLFLAGMFGQGALFMFAGIATYDYWGWRKFFR